MKVIGVLRNIFGHVFLFSVLVGAAACVCRLYVSCGVWSWPAVAVRGGHMLDLQHLHLSRHLK